MGHGICVVLVVTGWWWHLGDIVWPIMATTLTEPYSAFMRLCLQADPLLARILFSLAGLSPSTCPRVVVFSLLLHYGLSATGHGFPSKSCCGFPGIILFSWRINLQHCSWEADHLCYWTQMLHPALPLKSRQYNGLGHFLYPFCI